MSNWTTSTPIEPKYYFYCFAGNGAKNGSLFGNNVISFYGPFNIVAATKSESGMNNSPVIIVSWQEISRITYHDYVRYVTELSIKAAPGKKHLKVVPLQEVRNENKAD